MLDFFDATIDKEGRVLLAGEDGCISGCVDGPPNSFTAKAFITRQTGGKRLFAQYDPVEPALPGAPLVTGYRNPETVRIFPGLCPITEANNHSYNVYRSQWRPFALLATVQENNLPTRVRCHRAYRFTAVNAQGEGPYCSDFVPAPAPPPTACDALLRVITDILTNGQDTISAQYSGHSRMNTATSLCGAVSRAGVNNRLPFQVAPSTMGAPPSTQWYIIWIIEPEHDFNRNWVE